MKLIKIISKLRPTFYGLCSTRNGFTLIELLVSIAIIIIISSAVMVGRNGAEQEMFLRTTAFSLSQNLREFQEKALSGEKNACGGKEVCGFGANFIVGQEEYKLFVDCAVKCSSEPNYRKLDGNDIVLSTISLGKAKIKSVAGPGFHAPSGTEFNVVFSPPDPVVYFYDQTWGNEELVITLCLRDDCNTTKTIKLNNAGKIEIQ